MKSPLAILALVATFFTVVLVSCSHHDDPAESAPIPTAFTSDAPPTTQIAQQLGFTFPPAPQTGKRLAADVRRANIGCVSCHDSDSHNMHSTTKTEICCIDCHGGHQSVKVPDALLASFLDPAKSAADQEKAYTDTAAAQRNAYAQLRASDPSKYDAAKNASHVHPKIPELWNKGAANPEVPGALTLQESADYIRFVNPGDLRAAHVACASCHPNETRNVPTSMMAHGAMLWGAAMYNNGSYNSKSPIFAEGYTPDGQPARILPSTRPTTRQVAEQGLLVELWPLPRWEVTLPGNVLRVFERGGKTRPQIGVPNILDDPGRPEVKLSLRGFGTDVRTDPVMIGLQKTRLLDPTLNFFGTNDHPGDYRGSGCSACHVIYANDRSPVHSGKWAAFGNRGRSHSKDPAVRSSGESIARLSSDGTHKPNIDGLHGQPFARKSKLDPKSSYDSGGQPIHHTFVKSMPTSTCITCHIHPGTNVLNSYLGFMWWDNESDAKFMYPAAQRNPTPEDEYKTHKHNPEGSAARGLWSDRNFLEQLGSDEFNAKLERVHFADFHGHGWVFRAVFKQDLHGNYLDHKGQKVTAMNAAAMKKGVEFNSAPRGKTDRPAPVTPPDNVPVHLKDIHLERGMHCVDCHFAQDAHGNGNLYGETRNAVMVECIDCHGDAGRPAQILKFLETSDNKLLDKVFTGNAAAKNPNDVQKKDIADTISDHFVGELDDSGENWRLWQKSALDPAKGWWVPQIKSTPAEGTDSQKLSLRAHTMREDGTTWGAAPDEKNPDSKPALKLAHGSDKMSCYACHSSWNTSCFGCHLPQRANQRKPMLHNESQILRNYTNYNYQTLRDDVYMLGVDSSTKGGKIVPIRSACAVMVSSQDALRQSLYTQQQTISAEGYAGTAFSPYFPHTVRTAETKRCNDCHVSKDNDNNAVLAQLMLQGTNSANFIGKWAWIAAGKGGVEAVAVTEATEPQAVIGSTLHKWAYPDNYRKHLAKNMALAEHHDHHGTVLDVQLRGEYLYAACGKDGFIAYDVANIDNKGFSERIITSPVSPLGQRFYVKSKYATSICSPSTLALDPTRERRPENQEGRIAEIGDPSKLIEQRSIHLLYAFLYLTDAEEGLIVIGNPLSEKKSKPGVATLLDGDPENNFLQRALTFNPNGLLKGAKHMALHGHHAYISCDAGIVVLNLNNPLQPVHVTTITGLSGARRVAFQFRYAFALDSTGLHVYDVTDIAKPVHVTHLAISDARDIYITRTYAYVAGGSAGLHIVDLEKPHQPKLVQTFNAGGKLSDTNAVRIGMTNSSMFAYVADGRNGLAVLQLTSPDDNPTYMGFSPRPDPKLIATHKTAGPALAVSEGLDRDRAVDEAGYQLSVFGRKGARPFTLAEMQRMYLRDGKVFTISDTPDTDPIKLGKPVATPATRPATAPTTRRTLPPRRPNP